MILRKKERKKKKRRKVFVTFQDINYENLVYYLGCLRVQSTFSVAVLCVHFSTHVYLISFSSYGLKVREHARKLFEKHMKKPFFDAR